MTRILAAIILGHIAIGLLVGAAVLNTPLPSITDRQQPYP